MSRAPYHTTPTGLYRTKMKHPITGKRIILSSRSLPDLMDRRARFEAIGRELGAAAACPRCGHELIAASSQEALAADLERLHAGNPKSPERGAVTIAAAWKLYEKDSPREHRMKLESVYRHQVEPFVGGTTPFLAFDEDRCERWTSALRKEGYSPKTIRNAFFFLAAAYRRCARTKLVPRRVPWGDWQPPAGHVSKRRRLLTQAEVMAIAGAVGGVSTQRGRLVLFAALTGLRNGELAALAWDDVDLARGVLYVRHQAVDEWRRHYPGKTRPDFPLKGRRERVQKLHDEARALLVMQARALAAAGISRPDGPVWPGDARGNWKRNATAIRSEVLQRAARRAGVSPKGVFAHALRHAAASWEIIGGADLASTAARLGHASVKTTADTYVHAPHLPASRIAPLGITREEGAPID